jgi:hypothetical protein
VTRILIAIWLAVLFLFVGAVLLFWANLSVPYVRSSTAKVWRPVPAALFSRWPAVPVDAGSKEPAMPTASPSGLAPRTSPSILPSGRQRPKSGPSATEAPTVVRTTAIPDYVAEKGVAGVATWWDSFGHGMYAAAGPRLRDVLPNYVGKWVTACLNQSSHQCVRVKLTTSCACQPDSRIIDLSLDAFSRLAAPSVGIVEVTVSW